MGGGVAIITCIYIIKLLEHKMLVECKIFGNDIILTQLKENVAVSCFHFSLENDVS